MSARPLGGMPQLSVVVPVLDDASPLADLLADLAAQQGLDIQVIVADGGSLDTSVATAVAAGADVVSSSPGRARQMNAGARAADACWLCFLHADSRLTSARQLVDALTALQDMVAEHDMPAIAGHFQLRFVGMPPAQRQRFLYRYMQAKTATGRQFTINGDQGVLIHRRFFDHLEGFDERMGFLEDQRLAAAVRRNGRWQLLPGTLITSARRFEREGGKRRYALMALIMALYIVDVPQFFERAPAVYAQQSQTARLALRPYLRVVKSLCRECGWRATLRVFWRIAGVTAGQSWQAFLALDIALAPLLDGARPCSALYRRVLYRLIETRLTQTLLVLLLPIVVFGPLQLWCALTDRPRLAD